jgi:hypothetical protein
MKLLGERNRYLPRWLEWLPRLDHGEATPHQGEPVADDEPLPAAAQHRVPRARYRPRGAGRT